MSLKKYKKKVCNAVNKYISTPKDLRTQHKINLSQIDRERIIFH